MVDVEIIGQFHTVATDLVLFKVELRIKRCITDGKLIK